MTILTRRYRPALYGAAVASITLLAACGGGGSSSIDTPVTPTPTQTSSTVAAPTKFACTDVAGPVNDAQFQITHTLIPQVHNLPAQVAPTLEALVAAVAQLLDLADGAAAGLQSLAATHNPSAVTAMIAQMSVTLRCAAAPMSSGLAGIQSQLPTNSIPQIALAQARLAEIAALLDASLGSGSVPSVGNLNMQLLSSEMSQLSELLVQITAQVTTKLPTNNFPLAANLVNVAMSHAASMFAATAALDHASLADQAQLLIQSVGLGIGEPLSTAALNTALTQITTQFSSVVPGLELLNTLLLGALSHVFNLG
jgi:hypothetical protein